MTRKGWRSFGFEQVGILIASVVLLASCATARNSSHPDSGTVYLPSGDRLLQRDPLGTRSADSAPPAGARRPPPGAAAPIAAVDDHLRARRAQLLRRVEDLSNVEADAVCLTMQLIPREQVFDRSIEPRKILLHYTSQATSAAELDFLERVLNDSRR